MSEIYTRPVKKHKVSGNNNKEKSIIYKNKNNSEKKKRNLSYLQTRIFQLQQTDVFQEKVRRTVSARITVLLFYYNNFNCLFSFFFLLNIN